MEKRILPTAAALWGVLKQVFLQEPTSWGDGVGACRWKSLGDMRTPTQRCGCCRRRGSGSTENFVRWARELGFIFTIKLVLKWLLKEYWNAEPFFFFTLYISSSSLYTCHQVDSQCNKNRQLVLNQVLAVWWVGPQNWRPGSSCSWGGVLRLWDGARDPIPFIGGWKWSESGLLLRSRFSRVRLCATPETAPTRLPRPWDSPGKNTGVGCHFLLQCMKVRSESEVAQSCLTPSDPMDCSPPGPSVHGLCQARILEWVAIAFKSLFEDCFIFINDLFLMIPSSSQNPKRTVVS